MILPVFLPHLGCRDRCIYCNQNHITQKRPGLAGVKEQIAALFQCKQEPAEIGLYGGNPLGLEASELDHLFRLFEPYSDRILSFRISAKPTKVSGAIIDTLERHGVATIELGIPTLTDDVLSMLNRGHTADEAVESYQRLKEAGFTMGIQVMVGLPGETPGHVKQTAGCMVRLEPSLLRIYPLVVLKDTVLFDLFTRGQFAPDTIGQAVRKAAFIYATAWRHGIKVIKMGLTENDVLREKIAEGPFHPAFGYLVKSEAFCVALLERCRMEGLTGDLLVGLHQSDIPHLIGPKRQGIERLRKEGLNVEWSVPGEAAPGRFTIEGRLTRTSGSLTDALPAFWRPMPICPEPISCNDAENFI